MSESAFHVLIPRPRPEAEETARAVEARGWRPIVSPLVEIEPVAPDGPRRADPPPEADALVVTSPRAVAHAPAAMLDVPAYVVGERTAGEWRARGGRVVATAPDGARLVASVRAARGRLVHLCGREIAFDFAAALPDADLRRMVVYEARPVPLSEAARDALAAGHASALLTSPRIAALLGREGTTVRALALSEAVAARWRACGGTAEVAARPTMAALLELLGDAPSRQP